MMRFPRETGSLKGIAARIRVAIADSPGYVFYSGIVGGTLVIPLDRPIIPLKRIRLLQSSVNEAFAFKSLSIETFRVPVVEGDKHDVNRINIDRKK